jgi:acetoin utilization deacetylase AcuC-like enzyme
VKAVLEALQGDAELASLIDRVEAREASVDELVPVHTPEYARWVREQCESGPRALDWDTPVAVESYRAALLAAGSVLVAVDAVLSPAHGTHAAPGGPPTADPTAAPGPIGAEKADVGSGAKGDTAGARAMDPDGNTVGGTVAGSGGAGSRSGEKENHSAAGKGLPNADGSKSSSRTKIKSAARRAFCPVRPPGHHAEKEKAMGFCLFNNIAVGARYAQKRGVDRVAIVDFDVHHGNGTEAAFYGDGTVLFISFHQYPHYPGTGGSRDMGEGAGKGFNINIPLSSGSGDGEYKTAMESTMIPAIERFKPNLVMISAGFDAHRDDPLSDLEVTEGGFGEITRGIVKASEKSAMGRVVSVLEGGYNLESMAASALAHARALAGLNE